MRKGSKQRASARRKRQRKKLEALVGRPTARAVIEGSCSIREAVADLSGIDRARAATLATQLHGEARR